MLQCPTGVAAPGNVKPQGVNIMNSKTTTKNEIGTKIENDHTARMLRDDELDAVTGGIAGMDVSKFIECHEI